MNSRLPPLILATCLFCPGCELAGNLARTAVYEVGSYSNECVEKHHCQQLANQAWDKFACTCGGNAFSKDYADGFKCGYEDYLFAGGSGDPPPFPPLCYRCARYETPEGYAAIRDWFEGYRLGATAARESGYRQYMILPMAAPVSAVAPPPSAGPVPTDGPPPAGDATPEQAPAPTPLPEPATAPAPVQALPAEPVPAPAQAPVPAPVQVPVLAPAPVLPPTSRAVPLPAQPGVANWIISGARRAGEWEP